MLVALESFIVSGVSYDQMELTIKDYEEDMGFHENDSRCEYGKIMYIFPFCCYLVVLIWLVYNAYE